MWAGNSSCPIEKRTRCLNHTQLVIDTMGIENIELHLAAIAEHASDPLKADLLNHSETYSANWAWNKKVISIAA
ncbi:MAG: hypothetical protein JAY90_21485 [Candidatus Thiodiazotropha lotti]|nr:hypothetical protein [Candidatus Thiodiazotropha lotti]